MINLKLVLIVGLTIISHKVDKDIEYFSIVLTGYVEYFYVLFEN